MSFVETGPELGARRRQRALQVYLACIALSSIWTFFVWGPPWAVFVSVMLIVPGFIVLKTAFGNGIGYVGYTVGAAVLFLTILLHPGKSYPVTGPIIPPGLSGLEVKYRGIVTIPPATDPPEWSREAVMWIRQPSKVVEARLRTNGTKGRGFDTADTEVTCHVDFESGEAWNIYTGQRTIPKFPEMSGSTVNPDTQGTWCTLFYQPPINRK